jgi:putative spermidine/putrescine transport system ATP-binding protein
MSTDNQHYVSVRALSKSFEEQHVFENLDFDIAKGEFVTLLGPSGCGKSTLLRCLAGLEQPDTGSISVDGVDITRAKAQKRGIGMVFQSYALFPNMTVTENIAFGLKMQRVAASEIASRVERGVALVELQGNEKKYPHQLSGGQKQRVALARALVTEPRILLLDEPLSALDARIRRSLREQIREIQKDLHLTTVFVTHDQEEAMTISDRIFLMSKGKIVQKATPDEIYLNPINEFAARFIGSYNLLTRDQARDVLGFETTCGLIAVRPESIYIAQDGGLYPPSCSRPVKAVIDSHQLLGNVIRYRARLAGDLFLTVDVMNRSSSRLVEPGAEVSLLFNMAEIRPLSE